MTIQDFDGLRRRAEALGPRRVAVAAADDIVALEAVAAAAQLGIAIPVLVGDTARIRAAAGANTPPGARLVEAPQDPAAAAVALVRSGEADILMKGHVRTDQLMHAVLDKERGLRTGRLLSDVVLFEYGQGPARRLIALSDGGLNVAPDLDQKRQIIYNAIDVLRALGVARPKIALMSATEAVSPAVPSTVDAQALTAMGAAGEFNGAEVFGPLALDNALLESAARAKGISSPVAGHADCLLVPNIEAGNMLGKAAKYFLGSACAHVVAGALAPVLIPSRVESAADKLNAIALGVVYAAR
jgi:phosphate butyryltransferase